MCSIYGMINFSVAMVTARQQSVPASRKRRPEQKGSNERKKGCEKHRRGRKDGEAMGGGGVIFFFFPIVSLERRDELRDEI